MINLILCALVFFIIYIIVLVVLVLIGSTQVLVPNVVINVISKYNFYLHLVHS